MNKKELITVGILTILTAFMDISGLPCALFVNIEVLDIAPFYWALMCNFIVIGVIVFPVLKFLCPDWKLGLNAEGIAAGILSGAAFFIGLQPFDNKPTVLKVLIEGIIYYFGVAFVEELYVRGLLLNLIEKLFANRKNKTAIAVISSSLIFGIGHIFGVLGQPFLTIAAKVIWTVALGLYFGVIYKKINNLWLPIILHFLIDISAMPYCFSTAAAYPEISLYIILPVYILLGLYSFYIMKKDDFSV